MRKRIIFVCLLFINLFLFSANQEQTNLDSDTYEITATTTVVNLNLSDNQTVIVFKDTLLFEEDFSNFSRGGFLGTATKIGDENILTLLPNSMTQMSGTRVRNLKPTSDNACNLQYSTSKFRTPLLDIPNNSQMSFRVKNGDSKSQLTVRDTVFHLKKNADSIKFIYLSNLSFVEFGKIEGEGNTLLIDDIKITTPREIVPYTLNDSNLLCLQGLTPNTKYYIEILNSDSTLANTFFFTTKKQIENLSSQIENAYTVSLSWINNNPLQTFSFSVDSVSNASDDLLISKVASTTNINVVEIYNPTERDICLKDYEFVGYNNSTTLSANPLRYTFFENDSIKSNSCILIALNSKISPQDSNLIVYPCKSHGGFSGGNDSYIILKKITETTYDTIDLFGMLMSSPSSYANSILLRKPNVRCGRKNNPVDINTVYDEWNISEYDTAILNSILGAHVMDFPLTNYNLSNIVLSVEQDSIQLTDVYFDGVYKCDIKEGNQILASTTFRMGREITAVSDGEWNNADIWQNGLIPTYLDRVVLPRGVKINVPDNITAECAELVLKSEYSTCDTTNKSEIISNGNILIGKAIVNPYFSAYTFGENGLTFFGLPISIEGKTRNEIANSFNKEANDDLYYFRENFSDVAWVEYDENIIDENFFKQNLGYLVAYSQCKELNWQGELFLEAELELLNNASFTQQSGNGYHLCANPYPFSVKRSNFSTNNIAGMWLLTPSTGEYIPYNPNEPLDFIIPPFSGFMTKVESNENLLKIHREALEQPSQSKSATNKLHFTLSYDEGKDEAKIYFKENVTQSIDEFDVYKLHSFGTAPDLYSTFCGKELSIVSLPLWEDSIIIPITYITKNIADYELRVNSIPQNVLRAELYDINNELLIDFVQDSLYEFTSHIDDEEKTLTLKLYSFYQDIAQPNNISNYKILQNRDLLEVISNYDIERLVLYDTKGIAVAESKTNQIKIPKEGCFILNIKIKEMDYYNQVLFF
jgi:hypothetical protein